MSKLARSNQETMDEIDHQLSDDGDYRHRDNGPTENSRETPPFITALKNGGTKEEAIFALERMWEEQCGLRKILRMCLVDYSHPNFTDRHGMAARIRAVLK